MRTVSVKPETWLLVLLMNALMAQPLSADSIPQAAAEFFEARVRPLLAERCIRCHGDKDALAGLRLDSREGWMTGGERGPAIIPGEPEQSLVIRAVRYQDSELQMPPADDGGQLSASEIAILEEWVRLGAVDPRTGKPAVARDFQSARNHWAFQPVAPPTLTDSGVTVAEASKSPGLSELNPVDVLIDRHLNKAGFEPVPAADAPTLARRVSVALTGLPATSDQIALAGSDFARLVSELLQSPRYGERWARHWLDVARYADTKDGVLMYGDGRIRPFAYTYRDYVIRAFNDDKPYDQFIREQLAADQLGLPENSPDLAAMGFLTLGRMFDNNPHDVIDDQIDVVTRGLLGLTVSCARCHDHKFDPIPIADYYSLHGVFAGSTQPFDRPRIEAPAEAGAAFETELATKLAALQHMRTEQHRLQIRAARDRVSEYLTKVATTEPDVSETSVFFLSLLDDDLRPQIVNRWRKLIARRLKADDPVFGPWHDLVKQPEVTSEENRDASSYVSQWRQRGIDERVIKAVAGILQTPADNAAVASIPPQNRESAISPAVIAQAYGTLLSSIAASLPADTSPSETRSDLLEQLVAGPASPGWFPESQAWYYMSRHEKDKYGGMISELDLIATKAPQAAARAMVMTDAQELYVPVIFRRGDPTQPGDPVPRQFLKVLSPETRQPFTQGSGRLELAREITRADNPLTARVWVNRVWMHHFGEPLVENPSDFGLRTERPLQAELLDFLAGELIRNDWKIKPLHQLIMSSRAWQRSSHVITDDARKTAVWMAQQNQDPTNRLLWRANRRRLDMESLRDSILAISGQLDLTMYGRPLPVDDSNNRRRTIYGLVERQSIPNIVRSFDVASADASVARRTMTTVPQQALFAMNSAFMTQAAAALAARTHADDPKDRITQLHQLVFGRIPAADEMTTATEFVATSSWEQYAQVLLMTNELMFVD
jgi:mono/diheme cytochrome c family protein